MEEKRRFDLQAVSTDMDKLFLYEILFGSGKKYFFIQGNDSEYTDVLRKGDAIIVDPEGTPGHGDIMCVDIDGIAYSCRCVVLDGRIYAEKLDDTHALTELKDIEEQVIGVVSHVIHRTEVSYFDEFFACCEDEPA